MLHLLCSHDSILSSEKKHERGTVPIPVFACKEIGAQTGEVTYP